MLLPVRHPCSVSAFLGKLGKGGCRIPVPLSGSAHGQVPDWRERESTMFKSPRTSWETTFVDGREIGLKLSSLDLNLYHSFSASTESFNWIADIFSTFLAVPKCHWVRHKKLLPCSCGPSLTCAKCLTTNGDCECPLLRANQNPALRYHVDFGVVGPDWRPRIATLVWVRLDHQQSVGNLGDLIVIPIIVVSPVFVSRFVSLPRVYTPPTLNLVATPGTGKLGD